MRLCVESAGGVYDYLALSDGVVRQVCRAGNQFSQSSSQDMAYFMTSVVEIRLFVQRSRKLVSHRSVPYIGLG
jgi:hypothetical protein